MEARQSETSTSPAATTSLSRQHQRWVRESLGQWLDRQVFGGVNLAAPARWESREAR